jgi:hypothetical protein
MLFNLIPLLLDGDKIFIIYASFFCTVWLLFARTAPIFSPSFL